MILAAIIFALAPAPSCYVDDVRVGDGLAPQLVEVCLGQGVPPAECVRRCELGVLHALYGRDYQPDAGAFATQACTELVAAAIDGGAPMCAEDGG